MHEKVKKLEEWLHGKNILRTKYTQIRSLLLYWTPRENFFCRFGAITGGDLAPKFEAPFCTSCLEVSFLKAENISYYCLQIQLGFKNMSENIKIIYKKKLALKMF